MPSHTPAPDRVRRLTPQPLNVAPALVGLPLATPARRCWAMLVDLALIGLLSTVSGLWLMVALGLLVWQLLRKPAATAVVTTSAPRWRTAAGWGGVLVLAVLVVAQAGSNWNDRGEDGEPPPTRRARAALARVPDAAADPASAALQNSEPAMTSPPGELSEAERIVQLETELARAREDASLARKAAAKTVERSREWSFSDQLERALDALGLSFGWGIVYFSVLPAWWGGQTLGKKLLRLRVLELTGAPMTPMRCLKRYGGYAAGMATGGLGFLQMLWDPNRQAIQDKTAHTVVVDLRGVGAEEASVATRP